MNDLKMRDMKRQKVGKRSILTRMIEKIEIATEK